MAPRICKSTPTNQAPQKSLLLLTKNLRFLVPALHIQSILDEPTAGDMEDTLGRTSQDLYETYENSLTRIQSQSASRSRLGMSTLSWIFHAARPLKLPELLDAVAIRPGQSVLNSRYKPSARLLLSCCMGLVTIDQHSSDVRLVHYSAQEYFEITASALFPSGQEDISAACSTYLMAENFCDAPYATERKIADCIEAYPFVVYAAACWGYHLPREVSEQINELATIFLSTKRHLAFATQICDYSKGYREIYWELEEVNSVTPLHVACHQQSAAAVRAVFAIGDVDIDAQTNIGTTALMRAASVGNATIVSLLLEQGADPKKTNWYGTTMHSAAEAGHSAVIDLLLKHGMNVDIRDRDDRTALHCAVDRDRYQATLLLIERGADINVMDVLGQRPLHLAAGFASTQMVELLLLQGCPDIKATTKSSRIALHYAIIAGRSDVINLLVKHGSPLDIGDKHDFTPLHYAARGQYYDSVRTLLDYGANPNFRSTSGDTPLDVVAAFDKHCSTHALLRKVTK